MTCVIVLGLLLLMALSGEAIALERRFGSLGEAIGEAIEAFHIRPLISEDEQVVDGEVLGFRIPSSKIRTFVIDGRLDGVRPQWSSSNESAVRICDTYTSSVIIHTGMCGRALLEVQIDGAYVAILIVVG